MDPVYAMLFQETRRALGELRAGNVVEAKRALEGVVMLDQFIRLYRRRDRSALRAAAILRRLEWEQWTPEGRLEWERIWSLRARPESWEWERIEWDREMEAARRELGVP